MSTEMKAPTAYACNNCERLFASKQQLLVHQYIHKEKPNLTCNTCSKTLPHEAAFRRHQRMHLREAREGLSDGTHAPVHRRRRLCPQCNQPFESRASLEEHHRREHMSDKLFACNLCDAQFSWPANLTRHQRAHANTPSKTQEEDPARKYVCKICQKGFRFDFSYEAHLNSHEVAASAAAKKETAVAASSAEKTSAVIEGATVVDSEGDTRELIVEIVNVPGEPMASAVTIDPHNFTSKVNDASSANAQPAQYTLVKPKMMPPEPVKVIITDDDDPPPLKKNKRRRRRPDPLIYDFTMTPEKPFVCEVCDMPFRWQISLYVHMRDHFGVEPGLDVTYRGRPRTRGGRGGRGAIVKRPVGRPRSSPKRSQIVQQRASSDEEEDYRDDYVVRRRGRGRFTSVRSRGGAPSAKRGRGAEQEDWMLVDSAAVKAEQMKTGAQELKTEGEKSTAAADAGEGPAPAAAAPARQATRISKRIAAKRVRAVKRASKHGSGGHKDLFAVWAAPVVAAHLQWQNRHVRDRRAFTCGTCTHALPTRALRDAHRMRHIARYQCRLCLRCFSCAATAAIHRLSHPATKARHRCALCAKQFRTVAAVKTHVKAHTPAFIAYVCTACGRRFAKPDSLRAHAADCAASVKAKHTCEVCHRVFTRKRFYEIHRRSGCIFGAFDDDTSTTL